MASRVLSGCQAIASAFVALMVRGGVGGQVGAPQLQSTAEIPHGQPCAVGAPGQRDDGETGVHRRLLHHAIGPPEPHRAVVSGRGQPPAIGAPDDGKDPP